MSVKRAKMEIDPLEFLQWQLKCMLDEEDAIRREWENESRSDYYMAQIAKEINDLHRSLYAIFSKPWPSIPIDKFKIKFETAVVGTGTKATKVKELAKPVEKRIEDMTPEEILAKKKEVSLRSRQAWGALLGLHPERDA